MTREKVDQIVREAGRSTSTLSGIYFIVAMLAAIWEELRELREEAKRT